MTIQEKSTLYSSVSILLSAFIIVYYFAIINDATKIIQTSIPEQIRMLNQSILTRYLAEQTVYYDEVLTQSVRNYAFTEDNYWQGRYLNYEALLEDIITRSLQQGSEEDIKNFQQLQNINEDLLTIESKSFVLVDAGEGVAAIQLLNSDNYAKLKEDYLASIKDYILEKEEQLNSILNSIEMLVAEQQSNEIQAFNNLKIGIITYALLLLGLIFFSNAIFNQTLATRIISLKEGAEKIAKGNFDFTIDLPTKDEFESLASTLNSMGANLKTVTEKLNREMINKQLANQRKTFSRELHDRLGILISSLKLSLEKLAPNNRNTLSENLPGIYKDCIRLLNEAYAQIRELANNPIPDTILQNGLKESLHQLFTRTEMIFSINIQFITNVSESDFKESDKSSLYSLSRELLNNSIKHANCSSIIIQIIKHDDSILFMFEDDGAGFELSELSDNLGKGLKNAEERVRQMGGEFFIDALPQRGTTISFELPLNN